MRRTTSHRPPRARSPRLSLWLPGAAAILFIGAACSGGTTAETTNRTEAAQSAPDEGEVANADIPRPATPPKADVEARAVAYFAGGCFWGVEYFLEQLPGVASVESGYMGGRIENPSYEDVLGHQSGHLESVRVRYDPDVTNYETLARRFFEIHDPTQANGQGPDIGPQYLSAVFVANDEERKTIERLISQLEARDYDVVTEIKPVTDFWEAEDYHQNYYVRHEKKPYCHRPVDRFGDGA